MNVRLIVRVLIGVVAVFNAISIMAKENADSAKDLITQRCGGCHVSDNNGGWSRISEQRKTPEGWLMTLVRMTKSRGAYLSDEERQQLVKYFADTQGLAPSETQDYRYILEHRENTVEQWDSQLYKEMCARCHSGTRAAIQRRTEGEWNKLVHFHLGQYPSLEYQAMARDRDWFNLAFDKMVPYLADKFSYSDPAWEAWQKAEKHSLQGSWRLVGHQPGRGDYEGRMHVSEANAGHYTVVFEGQYTDGESLNGEGEAIVYTGYEWRGSLTFNGVQRQQVFALDETGRVMSGRMFVSDEHEKYSSVALVREEADSTQVLAVYPAYVKAGSEARVTIVGSNLKGELTLDSDMEILNEVSRSADRLVVDIAVAKTAGETRRRIILGNIESEPLLAVYRQIDVVTVEPAYGVARVGGGQTPAVLGIFEAIGISAGADGKVGTQDDLRLGSVPAEWSVQPFDDAADHDRDVEFAGTMNAKTGVFTPAEAGPNPQRRFSTNNVGNLSVLARVLDGERQLDGQGQLLVTVQRWNNSPIR